MAIKFKCDCGVPLIALTKKPGETMTCNNCGTEMTVPSDSNFQTGSIITGVIPQITPEEAVEVSELEDTVSIENQTDPQATPQPTVTEKPTVPQIAIAPPPPALQETPPQIIEEGPIQNQMPPAEAPAPPVAKSNLKVKGKPNKNAPIKCQKCGKISQPGAVICIECGTNLRTGKTHFAPTATKSSGASDFFNAKNLNAMFRIGAVIVFLIIAAIFLPKIWGVVKNVPNLFDSDSPNNFKTVNKSPKKIELDYSKINKKYIDSIMQKANQEAREEYLSKHPDCYIKVLDKAREIYQFPNFRIGKEVTFKTTRGITKKGILEMPLSPDKISLKITDNQSNFQKTVTIKKEQIDPAFHYLFFFKEFEKEYQQYIKKHVPDIEKQQKDFIAFKRKIEERIFQAEGYGWCNKTNQWVPIKKRSLLEDNDNMVGSKKLSPKGRTKLGATDPGIPIQHATFNLTPYVQSSPSVVIKATLTIPKTCNDEIGIEIFRARRKKGKYQLIHCSDLLPKKGNSKFSVLSTHFTDTSPKEEKSNNVYYKIRVFQNDHYREFSPIKVPIILPPEVKNNKWTWTPIESNGESIDAFIMEYIKVSSNKFYTFAETLKNSITKDFSKLDKNTRAVIEIRMKQTKSRVIKNDNGIITINKIIFNISKGFGISQTYYTKNLIEDDKKAIHLGVIPKFNNFSDFFSNITWQYNRKTFTEKMEKIKLNGKTLNHPCSLGPNGLKYFKRKRTYRTRNIFGKNGEICLKISDGNTKKILAKPLLKFHIPLSAPNIFFQSTLKGNIISWQPIKLNKTDYLIPPQLIIERSGDVVYAGPPDAKTSSFCDTAIKKGEKVSYKAYLSDGFIKTQGWILGFEKKNFFTDISHFAGYAKAIAKQNSENIKLKNQVICKNDSFKLFSSKPDYPKISEEHNKNITSRPLRIGIQKPDMCHNFTGNIEVALLEKITNALFKNKNFVVFNRINKNSLIDESTLNKLYGKADDKYSYGLDFLIRLRDFSRAEGNGVELWLTQVTDPQNQLEEGEISNLNFNASWRIGKIYFGQNNEIAYGKIISKLFEKIEKLRNSKPATVKYKEYNPKNIIFNTLKPIQQASQVWQSKEISETLMLEVADNCPEKNILSRDNWETLISEQIALGENGIKSKVITGDIIITGNIWKEKDKTQFLLFATDIKNGVFIDYLRTGNNLENVVKDISEWFKGLKKPQLPLPGCYPGNKISLRDERYSNTFPIERLYPVKEYKHKYSNLSNRSILNKYKKFRKTEILPLETIKKKSIASINENLALHYHMLGLYASEIKVYQYILSHSTPKNKAQIIKRMEKAKILAQKSSPLLTLSLPKKRQKRKKSYSFDEPLGNNKNLLGRLSSNENNQYQELIHCARNKTGEEWNSQNLVMYRNLFCFGNISYKEYLKNKYGVWKTLQTLKTRKNKNSFRVWLTLWQPQPFYSEKIKKMYPDCIISAEPKGSLNQMRYALNLYNHPNIIIYNNGNKYSGKELLKFWSYTRKKPKDIKEWQIDNLFATDLYAKFDPKAKNIINYVMNKKIPRKKLRLYSSDDSILTFQAFKGNTQAITSILNFIKKGKESGFKDKEMLLLFALSGREKILKAILPHVRDTNDIKSLRWGKKETVKKLLLSGVIKGEAFYYLVNGFSIKEATPLLLDKNSEYAESALVLLHGKPLQEIEEEYELKQD